MKKQVKDKTKDKTKKDEKPKQPKEKKVDLPNESDIREALFGFENNDNDELTEGENIAETIKAWLSDDHIHAKTRLNANQIIALTILKTLSEKYNITCIKALINNFVRYKLSEGGQSSKELVDILKNRNVDEIDDGLMKAVEPFLK